MPDRELVQLAVDGEVATVTLDRPEKLNALTLDMLDAADADCRAPRRRQGAALRDSHRRGRPGLLRRRRHPRVVGAGAARHVAHLDQARPSGVRPVGAAAASGHRGDQRTCAGRRAGARRRRRHPRRRDRGDLRAAGSLDRHRPRLVRHAASGHADRREPRKVPRADRPPHRRRRGVPDRPHRRAGQRRPVGQARRRSPTTSAAWRRFRCSSPSSSIDAGSGEGLAAALEGDGERRSPRAPQDAREGKASFVAEARAHVTKEAERGTPQRRQYDSRTAAARPQSGNS